MSDMKVIKVKGGCKVDVWFDESIRMYGATYKDAKGNTLCDAEFAPSKALALQWLKENGPKIEIEKDPGRSNSGGEY